MQTSVAVSPTTFGAIDKLGRINSRGANPDARLRADSCIFPEPNRVHRIPTAVPFAMNGVALDLRARTAVTHPAFQIAEVAHLQFQKCRIVVDPKSGSRAEFLH